MRQESGFTLIEMMIVVAMVGILAAVGTAQFDHMRSVNSINEDMHKVSSFVHSQKMLAFTQKLNVYLTIAGTQITTTRDPSGDDTIGPPLVDPSGDDIAGATLTLQNTLRSTAATFTIDPRGNITTGNISINAVNTGAEFSCVSLDNVRIRLGVWNGANCTAI